MKCRAFGVNIIINFSFFIIFALALVFGNKQILYVVLFSSLHEIGHIVTLYCLGGKAEAIRISFYGIGLTHSSKLNWKNELVFLLSGIFVNLIFVILNIYRKINLTLVLINSLPIYPLDIGRCIMLLMDNFLPISISYKLMTTISFLQILAIFTYSICVKNYNLTLIDIYLFIFWLKEVIYD